MIVESATAWPTDDYVSMMGIESPHWARTEEMIRIGETIPGHDEMRGIASRALLERGLIVSGNGKFASRNLVIGDVVYMRQRAYTMARADRSGVEDAASDLAGFMAARHGPGRIYAIDPTFIYLRKRDTDSDSVRLIRKCLSRDCSHFMTHDKPHHFDGEPRILIGCYYAHVPPGVS